MSDGKDIQTDGSALKLDEIAREEPLVTEHVQPLATEHTEKGSLRSMWELLMQLRVLLPYLTRLVPLLDRGLLKAAPDLTEFRKDLQSVQAGSREMGTQVRNQALQLERMEELLLRLREMGERNQKDAGELSRRLDSLTGWVRALAILTALIFVALIVLAVLYFSGVGK